MAKRQKNKEREEAVEEIKVEEEQPKMAEKEDFEAKQPEIKDVEDEEEDVDESKLPFPKATIVNMMRRHLSQGKQIKGRVKTEMNLWLGQVVERVSRKMDAYPYTYVDGSMFREAVEPYEQLQEIEKEKERIIKQLESIKAECDVLVNEVDRQFVLRSGFANEYLKQADKNKEKKKQQ